MSFSTDPGRPDGDEAPARRILILFAASLIAVGLGGLVFVTLNRDSFTKQTKAAATASGATPDAGIGPQPGGEIAAYLNERSAALAASGGERTAVVSFVDYLSEAQARATVGQARIVSLLAAVPGGAPGVVNAGLADWVAGQVADKRDDRDQIQQLLPTVDDPQFKAFYQEEVDRLDALLEGVKPDGPLVFGVVVRAPVADLKSLARSPQVRLVDVAPTATVKSGAPIRGLRPEEKVKANDPATRPS